MALNPTFEEQQLLASARARQITRLSSRERAAELLVGGAYVLVALAIVLHWPPELGSVNWLSVAACLIAFAVASRTEFDTGAGITVPTQLAFVPLLFSLPPSLVAVCVPAAWALAKLPEVLRGEMRITRLFAVFGNSWFVVGPVLVLSVSGTTEVQQADAAVLLAALAAQFAGDFGASAVREWLSRGASLREQLGDLWVYAVDAALAPVGLLAVYAMDEVPWGPVALIPLIGVLAIFSRERRRRIENLSELNHAYQGMALVLGDVVEHDDGYTGEHCRDVVALALATGTRLGLGPDRMRNLEFAALLHDVGKVAIPKAIINKPGKLDPDEWELIKTHTIEGQRMLDRVGGFMSDVGLIVRSHHERWDGDGYPDALAGDTIPLEARIITCCDSYNAMTTTRSYRKALSAEVATREMLDCSGSQFDPAVVDAMLASLSDEQVKS
ncbi:HD-GYP domain-containing protein [Solirubrobacter soli]|uniref:HD-GYP domain-containing protein n=1 Tax=Solirubrobacter soli TaxID=363832 RepID=UPI0004183E8D|nr:HD-GYP domain-containing protein [Solirubrobacter soli]